jgi:CRP/FNR family transcriptional regulator, nitrogen oxide reductase regulator
MKGTATGAMTKDCANCNSRLLPGKRVGDLPPGLLPRLLSGLPKTALLDILSTASHRQFPASSVVIHDGNPAERFFILTSGQGRHFMLTGDGRKILMNWLTPGQIFGGAALLSTPSHYLASTEVSLNSCALVWDRKTIRELVSRFPVLLDNAFSIAVTENIAWFVAARVSLSSEDATGRIAQMLLSLASGIGNAGPEGVDIRVGNEDLAAGANVTPFTVSRSLAAWQREGVLTKGRGKILLRKPELLVTR